MRDPHPPTSQSVGCRLAPLCPSNRGGTALSHHELMTHRRTHNLPDHLKRWCANRSNDEGLYAEHILSQFLFLRNGELCLKITAGILNRGIDWEECGRAGRGYADPDGHPGTKWRQDSKIEIRMGGTRVNQITHPTH